MTERNIVMYDNVFSKIDTSEKEYFLGMVLSMYSIGKDFVDIHVKKDNGRALRKMKYNLFGNMLKINKNKETESVRIYSKRVIDDLCKIDINNINSIHMLRGIYENCGWCHFNKCHIVLKNKELLEYFLEKLSLTSCNINEDVENSTYSVSFKYDRALDALNKLYDNVEYVYNIRRYEEYREMCGYIPANKMYKFNYKKVDENAKDPFKGRASDSGYDLTLIKKIKTVGNVEFYDTGIVLEPPFGYYFDLVGRSSISKSGYLLANNIGIIDRSYRGSVIVPLVKIDSTRDDLELPNRLVQIIPRLIQHLQPNEIKEVSETNRGTDGFGQSTGK